VEDDSSRRPLKTRSTEWARSMAKALTAAGISPNAISAFSVVAALAGGAAFIGAARGWIPWPVGWIAGAAMIQLRLLCNLMDGMVAIEGGKKSATGDLWNEIPDRLADTIFLVSAGWAIGLPWIGALAAWASVMTAYVRAMGASLTGVQDFCGPCAKPHRMAILTVAGLITAAESLWKGHGEVARIALIVIAAGACITIVRRIARLSTKLKEARP
jgi:phosphatidylglycerophosphate synthase